MMLTLMWMPPPPSFGNRRPAAPLRSGGLAQRQDAMGLTSVPVNLLMTRIRSTNAERQPPARPARGRGTRVLLGGGGRAELYPVRGVPADRRAGGRDGHHAGRAPAPGPEAHGVRPRAGRAHG